MPKPNPTKYLIGGGGLGWKSMFGCGYQGDVNSNYLIQPSLLRNLLLVHHCIRRLRGGQGMRLRIVVNSLRVAYVKATQKVLLAPPWARTAYYQTLSLLIEPIIPLKKSAGVDV